MTTFTEAKMMLETTDRIAVEILDGRLKAHAKHGANSIEALPGQDPMWGPILVEEGGEVAEVIVDMFAHSILAKALGRVGKRQTYDQDAALLRSELVDVATVAVAWIASLDRRDLWRDNGPSND